jgi:flagellar hook assembly protein FlgD
MAKTAAKTAAARNRPSLSNRSRHQNPKPTQEHTPMTTNPASIVPGLSTPGIAAPQAANKNVATKDAFLQLLVAQIKHQNPLSPADGVQFLSQLAQFTEMEQMLGMREDIAAIRKSLDPTQVPQG